MLRHYHRRRLIAVYFSGAFLQSVLALLRGRDVFERKLGFAGKQTGQGLALVAGA